MPGTQFRCEVDGLEVLSALRDDPLPLGLRADPVSHSFHRDVYLDTPDCALRNRKVACRLRIEANDRRFLGLLMPGTADPDEEVRWEAEVTALDPREAVLGDSEPARRLHALVDPADLRPWLQVETERWTRPARAGWFQPQVRLLFLYDHCIVRSGGLAREFQELGVRRVRSGGPSLDRVARALEAEHGLRPTPYPKHERASALLHAVEGEALARALGSGRSVALLAEDGDRLAMLEVGSALRLPVARGSGEDAVRYLLRRTFGSSVGDLALHGVAPGSSVRPAVEVWSARRIRTDGEGEGADPIRWLSLAEILGRVGEPGLRDPETLAALAVLARSSPQPAAVALRASTWRTEGERAARLEGATPGSSASRAVPGDRSARDADREALHEHAGYPAEHFLNAELSQVAFNLRVLELSEDRQVPLLERLRYLAIVSSNLDEFFAVRVGALKERTMLAPERHSPDGMTAEQELDAIAARIPDVVQRQQRCLDECLHGLRTRGLQLRRWGELTDEARERLRDHFRSELLPDLTPRALTLSPGHPFPVMPDRVLSFALMLRDDRSGPFHFAYLRLPPHLTRFLPVGPPGEYIRLEEVVRSDFAALYPDRAVEQAWLFRVTRSADLDVEEEEAGDFLQAIEEEVARRSLNPPVRVEVEQGMPRSLRSLLLRELRFEQREDPTPLGEMDVYDVPGMMDLSSLPTLAALAETELGAEARGQRLTFPPFLARDVLPADASLWDVIRAGDQLLHHPYDAFRTSTQRFLEDAAGDPLVTTIKMTLYRAGDVSPIVDALCRAAESGKDVAVFVELKARFDERRNIAAVERMEGAGVQVIYGVVGLKNHAKVTLVVRREPEGVQRYAHIGTGNYNASTARFYTDLGLLTADAGITADLTDLFNQLTGSSASPRGVFRRLLVAPATMLEDLCGLIAREEAHARAGRPTRIRAQLNGIDEPEIIEALYRASAAGVRIELLVRGLCTLRPGLAGLSEHIQVRSLLGRFLEHTRIYHFANGGEGDKYFIGSADWRRRNLRRRVEVAVPIRDPALMARLDRILTGGLGEPAAWDLDPDGGYLRRQSIRNGQPHLHDRGGMAS